MASKIIECLGVKQALTFKQLCQLFGISHATGWRRIKDDPQFPKPYYVSEKCPRFDPDEAMSFRASRRAADINSIEPPGRHEIRPLRVRRKAGGSP